MPRPKKVVAPESETKPDISYISRFVPDRIKLALRGKRPPLMEIGNSAVQLVDGKNILRTYIFLGGVPTPALHAALTEGAGFILRRVVMEYHSKKLGRTFVHGADDNSCWAAYYAGGEGLTDAQLNIIAKLYTVCSRAGAEGRTFLCPNWGAVDDMWRDHGGRGGWLRLVAAPVEEKPAGVVPTGPIMLDGDAMLV